MTGRFSSFMRSGGRGRLKAILDGLNQRRAGALDTSLNGIVYAENEAIARMLWIAWEQNQRFANQFDPHRVTSMLPRWEKIFGLTPLDTDTLVARRAAVVDRWARLGVVPTHQTLTDRVRGVLGDIFLDLHTVPLANAVQWWPGGTPNPDAPWYSTTAHLLIHVAQPAGMPLGEFWRTLGRVNPVLDDLVSAFVTWDWYVESPSGSGFWLDEEHNLDHLVFD